MLQFITVFLIAFVLCTAGAALDEHVPTKWMNWSFIIGWLGAIISIRLFS